MGTAYAIGSLAIGYYKGGWVSSFALDYSSDGTNWTELVELSSPNTSGLHVFPDLQTSAITRPLIDGWGSPLIDGGFIR